MLVLLDGIAATKKTAATNIQLRIDGGMHSGGSNITSTFGYAHMKQFVFIIDFCHCSTMMWKAGN